MISKTDVLLLLTELQDNGQDVNKEISELYSQPTIPISVLKKVNSFRPLELTSFYEKLRRSYNNKRSKMYINIMKANENLQQDPKTVLTTLSALLNQILQFDSEDKTTFLKHARADEIAKVIGIYVETHNITPAYKLLTLIKSDIIALDYVTGRK